MVEDIARLDSGIPHWSARRRSARPWASRWRPIRRWVARALLGAGQTLGGLAAQSAGSAGLEDGTDRFAERVRPYQNFEVNAGSIMELLPGYKPHNISTGAPTAQEATAIGMLERRVCAALRTTPATLLGDYAALSFSAGQLGVIQERQSFRDRQMILSHQFYGPVVPATS